jgi:hypothetical protein
MSTASASHAAAGKDLTVGVIIHKHDVYRQHLAKSIEAVAPRIRLLEVDNRDNQSGRSIARIYNSLFMVDGPDLVAFLEPDVSFETDLVATILRAVESLERKATRWGAIGIVGRSWTGDYVWCHDVHEPTEVCALDSCSLVTRRSFGLRFDERRFDGFHCAVEDICLQGHAVGRPCFVVPATAKHFSSTLRAQGSQWGDYRRYRRKLTVKWWWRFPRIYTC